MQRSESFAPSSRPIPLALILMAAVAIHLPLLLMKLPLKSYDTNFHIFFASHYVHHWFDPWNPKWYAGFSQMTYPPLTQQWVAMVSHVFGLDMAYMAVQFAAILLLAVGVYRFSVLWVSPRAASFAALASVFLGSESFLVYSAGQLGTTSAAPIYLNALPFLYEWIRYGSWRSFLKATVLFAAAAAAHHATLLFGSIFFAVPILALAFMDRQEGERASTSAVAFRAAAITVVVGAAIAVVLLPFWIALLRYPVTQTPIPHASRANYILSPQWGLNYFVVPYGALVLALPFIFLRGSMVARLRPLLFGFWVAFMVGLGGTTPVGHLLLGRAFEVLTMERFSYWATLLALPFVGLLAAELIDRYRTKAVVGIDRPGSFYLRVRGGLGELSTCRCGRFSGRRGGLLAQSRWARQVQLHHTWIWQQDFATGRSNGRHQRGWGMELGAHVARTDQPRGRHPDEFQIPRKGGHGRAARHPAARGSLRPQVGHRSRFVLRSAAFVCRLAARSTIWKTRPS